jgi:TPR repeat protein
MARKTGKQDLPTLGECTGYICGFFTIKPFLLTPVKWSVEAARQEASKYALGVTTREKTVFFKDNEQAAQWYLKAVEQGDSRAKLCLAYMLLIGLGVSQDTEKAACWIRGAAEAGDREAQYMFACMLLDGAGVAQDYDLGVEFLVKSARQSKNTEAHDVLLKLIWAEKADAQKVYKAYSQASTEDYLYCQVALGRMCKKGRGVAQDMGKALEWFRKAAEQKLGFFGIVEFFDLLVLDK